MSDDPQSEKDQSYLLAEQTRLLKAQQHLEQVLSGGAGTADLEMHDVGPQTSEDHTSHVEQMHEERSIKADISPAPLTPGTFELQK